MVYHKMSMGVERESDELVIYPVEFPFLLILQHMILSSRPTFCGVTTCACGAPVCGVVMDVQSGILEPRLHNLVFVGPLDAEGGA